MQEDSRTLARLRDYKNYHSFTESELDELLLLILKISSNIILNKVFFVDEKMCRKYQNAFYELGSVHLLVTGSIIIGESRHRILRIMTLKNNFMKDKYFDPLGFYRHRISKLSEEIDPTSSYRPITSSAKHEIYLRNDDDSTCFLL